MKLINHSKEFVLQYNGSDFTIPKGEFEVFSSALGNHILFIAAKWGNDVREVSSGVMQIIQTKKIIPTPVIKSLTPKVEDSKEDTSNQTPSQNPVTSPVSRRGRPAKDAK